MTGMLMMLVAWWY